MTSTQVPPIDAHLAPSNNDHNSAALLHVNPARTIEAPDRYLFSELQISTSRPRFVFANMANNPQAGLPASGNSSKEPGLRYPSNGKTIYHRPLNRTKTAELSQASFAYLFGEMVTYAQRRVKGIQELEQR